MGVEVRTAGDSYHRYEIKLKKGVVTKVLLRVCRVPRAWFTSQGGSKRRPI